MELVTPDIGLLFWMTTCFIILLILMKKFAWAPILKALSEREQGIQLALEQAELPVLHDLAKSNLENAEANLTDVAYEDLGTLGEGMTACKKAMETSQERMIR